MSLVRPSVAYFSMEIALETHLPTYSGGLGVLAGDTLRSCADLGLEVQAVTLAHRKGYFRQEFEDQGKQRELPDPWRPEDHLERVEAQVTLEIEGRPVKVGAWRYRIVGHRGAVVNVYLLDTDLPGNDAASRAITDHLYGGDDAYRLAQEAVLGIGGVRMLRALGCWNIDRFHLNEGHAALAIAELMEECVDSGETHPVEECHEHVRSRCVFTTHTPVPAGHDRFPAPLVQRMLGKRIQERLHALGVTDVLNMTEIALDGSRFVNGVAMRHGEVSRGMFPNYPIRSITNGIHPGTWAAPSFCELFDRHIPDWRSDPMSLRCATAIDVSEIATAHTDAKQNLIERVRVRAGTQLDPAALTIGFGRRATAYKRPTLVLRDLERLRKIGREVGPVQLVFAGKAHPRDDAGRSLLEEIHQAAAASADELRIVFLAGYDMEVCGALVAGCDVWLNTPVPPLEASGTSGMKAALNGVPSLSMLDGWWVEGCVEGITGWAIGADGDGAQVDEAERDALHAEALYTKLESVVAPCFYRDPDRFRSIMRQAIALNGSYFNTHRMALQYLFEAYRGDAIADPDAASTGASDAPKS